MCTCYYSHVHLQYSITPPPHLFMYGIGVWHLCRTCKYQSTHWHAGSYSHSFPNDVDRTHGFYKLTGASLDLEICFFFSCPFYYCVLRVHALPSVLFRTCCGNVYLVQTTLKHAILCSTCHGASTDLFPVDYIVMHTVHHYNYIVRGVFLWWTLYKINPNLTSIIYLHNREGHNQGAINKFGWTVSTYVPVKGGYYHLNKIFGKSTFN